MKTNEWKVKVHRFWDPAGLALRITRVEEDTKGPKRYLVLDREGEWTEAEPGKMVHDFISISEEQAQVLVNSLWEAGVKPEQAQGSAGQLAAVEKHLDDMRTLVSKHSGTWLPGTGPRTS